VFFASFTYQAQSWAKPRRVLAKVEWHQGERYRGSGSSSPPDPAGRAGGQILQRPRHGGAMDQGRQAGAALDAAVLSRLPGQRSPPAAVRAGLQLRELPARSLVLPNKVAQWLLTTLREKLVKIGARIVHHARYLVFQLAEVAVPRTLFAAIFRRIDR
jgi:hypothetical protein